MKMDNELRAILLAVIFAFLAVMMPDAYSAEYNYLEYGTGVNVNITGCHSCWDDAGELGSIIIFGRRVEYNQYYVDASWIHVSQLMAGCPFDCGTHESSVDHFGIRIGWKF